MVGGRFSSIKIEAKVIVLGASSGEGRTEIGCDPSREDRAALTSSRVGVLVAIKLQSVAASRIFFGLSKPLVAWSRHRMIGMQEDGRILPENITYQGRRGLDARKSSWIADEVVLT